jgi:type IV pilus assembly protein PilC
MAMEFVCKLGTVSGEVVEKNFTAQDEAVLRRDLQQQGYFVFSVRSSLSGMRFSFRSRRVPGSVLYIFCQELAALLKAGLPLVQCLEITLERQKDTLFRNSLMAVKERVKAGTSLSEAFIEEGDKYPPMLAASLVAGERSGTLELVLRRLVQHLRLSQSLKSKVVAASVYPAALLVVMLALMFVLVVKVIPNFEGFYEGLNAQIPFMTRGLFFASRTVTSHLLGIGVGFGVCLVGARLIFQRPGSRLAIDRALLRLPLIGGLMRKYSTAQLARTLATLLSGGLPLLNALEVASNSLGNRAVASALRASTPLIREGRSLTTALEATQQVDSLALEMVKVGEQTGALADMLNALAEFLDEELDVRVGALMALVEPMLLIVLAVVVGMTVLSFYLPLFESFALIEAGR